jgi:hypothetical protein
VTFNPFRVETTIEYRSILPVSVFQPDTEQLFGPTLPNDCLVELLDESGRTAQRLYGRMIFDSLPQATARVQPREADGSTVLSVTYVMPFLTVLTHRIFEFVCIIGGLALLRGWIWVLRHGWGNVSPDWRPMLGMGSYVFIIFSIGVLSQLPLSDYPSKLSVWLEEVGKLERLSESTD